MLYFDSAATSLPTQEVLDAVVPLLTENFGNPSSTHSVGERAKDALNSARDRAASTLGVRTGDIIFTSGGTEANNLAVKGLALGAPRGRHLVRSAIEHPSVTEACDYLVRWHGFTCDVIGVDEGGIVNLEELRATVRGDTTLISMMAVNNEIGSIQPIPEVSRIAQAVGALFHSDAVQAAGWLSLAELTTHVDALTISGHKIGGIKGGGIAMIRGRLSLEPNLHGGGQERERRSGTENTAAAVSTSVALAAAQQEVLNGVPSDMGQRLIDAVLTGLNTRDRERVKLTGHRHSRVPGIVSFVFPETNGETVLLELEHRGIVCSSGSACSAGSTDPSHVLIATGLSEEESHTAVRLSFGPDTTVESIDIAARSVIDAVRVIAGD